MKRALCMTNPTSLPTIGALLLLLLAAPRAHAAPSDEAARLAEAERSCLEGGVQHGIELLTGLYLETRHPAYLHNQARCYEQNGQYRQAAGRYREFLLKARTLAPEERAANPTLTAARLAEIETHAKELEQLAPPDRRSSRAEPVVAAPVPAPAPLSVQTVAPAPNAGSRGLRVTGVTTMVVGALTLGAASAAGIWAKRTESEISGSGEGSTFDAGKYQNGDRAARLATIGFIAAPALIGLGVLLYWGGTPDAPAPRTALRLVPTLSPDGAGALLALRY
jgi:hypothetical protein